MERSWCTGLRIQTGHYEEVRVLMNKRKGLKPETFILCVRLMMKSVMSVIEEVL